MPDDGSGPVGLDDVVSVTSPLDGLLKERREAGRKAEVIYVPPRKRHHLDFHFSALVSRIFPSIRARHVWEQQKLAEFPPEQRDVVLRYIKGNRRVRLQHKKHYYALEITRLDQERFLRRFKRKLRKEYGHRARFDDKQLLKDHYVQSLFARMKIIMGARRILSEIATLESRRMVDDWHGVVENPDLRSGAVTDTVLVACADPREDAKTASHMPILAGAYLIRSAGPSLESLANINEIDLRHAGFINLVLNGHVRNLSLMGHSGCALIKNTGLSKCSCCHESAQHGNQAARGRHVLEHSKDHIKDMVVKNGVDYYLRLIDSPPLSTEESWLRAMEVANVMHHREALHKLARDIVALYEEEHPGRTIPLPRITLAFHDMSTESILIFNDKAGKFISVAEPLKPGEKILHAPPERPINGNGGGTSGSGLFQRVSGAARALSL